MDTMMAFAMGQANRHRELMVFDWDKAAEIIRERKPAIACAGLGGDWEWTSGTIYKDGEPVKDSYTHLASTWAPPELEIDGKILDCYKMKSETPGWDDDTKWPESALAILNGGE